MNIRYWLLQKGWVVILPIIVAILAIWVWPNLYIPPVFIIDDQGVIWENTQTLYLLSSIAQSLAAILALVFTLSLITFQLSSRYSQRLIRQFFNRFTIIYIVVFVISIFLPLWTIVDPNHYIVKISLSLTAICLFLLIPYFLDLRERLSPEKMLEDLGKKTLKIIHSKPTKQPAEIVTLDNVVMSAFASKDYETCRIGIGVLADLAYEADKEGRQELEEEEYEEDIYSNFHLMLDIYEILVGIAYSSMDDPRVPHQVSRAILRNVKKAIDEGLGDIAEAAKNRVTTIGLESTKRGNYNVTDDILGFLGAITRLALEQNKNISIVGRVESFAESCTDDIVILGKEAVEARLPELTETVIQILPTIVESFLETGKLEISEKYLNRLLEIIGRMPYGLVVGEIGRIAFSRLFRLGVLFMVHQDEEKQHEIIKKLRNLEANIGRDCVESAVEKIPKYWSAKWERQIVQFRDIYEKSSK